MVVHQSNIRHLLNCPKAFQLSLESEITRSREMADGLILEQLVFGSKGNDIEELLSNGKKPTKAQLERLARFERFADAIRKRLKFGGYPFMKIGTEYKGLILEGEMDFFGVLNGEQVIADLKFTKSIDRIWMTKTRKADFLQAVAYNYIAKKSELTKEYIPFVYILVQNDTSETPLIKVVRVVVTDADAKWFESILDDIILFETYGEFPAEPNEYKCAKCPFIAHCAEGKSVTEEPITIEFGGLE